MITTYEKLKIVDQSENNHFFAEVNWAEHDEKTNQCKIIKFTFPDGNSAFVKKEDLFAFLFVIGQQSEQMKIVPQKLTRSRWYETVLGITAKKDIRKGEKINAYVKISLPSVEEEIITNIKKDVMKSDGLTTSAASGLILPK